MRWFFSPVLDYGGGLSAVPEDVHGFILDKPSRIWRELLAAGIVGPEDGEAAPAVTAADLLRVHDERLVRDLGDPRAVARALELPVLAVLPPDLLARAVVGPQLAAAGATREALRVGLGGGWACCLSGGYHHARRDLAHGFCLVNDVAVGLAALRQEGIRRRVLIVDLDLHQGDGNAAIFRDDPDVYTVSVHEEWIFPIPKERSDCDIGLWSYTGDADYLAAVDEALAHAARHFEPDAVVYVAGSDPYHRDPLGSLQVSREGLLERDRRVAAFAARAGCGLVVLPAGGYTPESPSLTAAGYREIAALEPRHG